MATADPDEMLRFLIEVFNAAARHEQGLATGATRTSLRESGAGRYLHMLAVQAALADDSPLDMEEAPDQLDAEEEAIWLAFHAEDADGD